MYKIGELSKIVDIPIKTLRYYDAFGILNPIKIDDFTGYRYYDDESVVECELIKLLKSVNFTLEEIKAYKNSENSEMFFYKQEEIKEEMEFLNKKLNRLQMMVKDSKSNKLEPKVYKKIPLETKEEIKLRRKYEKRNVREYF